MQFLKTVLQKLQSLSDLKFERRKESWNACNRFVDLDLIRRYKSLEEKNTFKEKSVYFPNKTIDKTNIKHFRNQFCKQSEPKTIGKSNFERWSFWNGTMIKCICILPFMQQLYVFFYKWEFLEQLLFFPFFYSTYGISILHFR